MFFKTKLCSKFHAGTCPYPTSCNFAHSVEELRRPPTNWQEKTAAREEDKGNPQDAREEYQILSIGGFAVESQRCHKGRHCKKFYSEEGCPYGEDCTFLHDEQSKNRESVTISLGPGGYEGGGGACTGTSSIVIGVGNSSPGSSTVSAKPSNWKTRICNKWELTGYCPFGAKCHFAHGATELHRYGGGLVEAEGKDTCSSQTDVKQGVSVSDTVSVMLSEGCQHSVSSQRSSMIEQRSGRRSQLKWKGPDRFSKIYGDWIDDVE